MERITSLNSKGPIGLSLTKETISANTLQAIAQKYALKVCTVLKGVVADCYNPTRYGYMLQR